MKSIAPLRSSIALVLALASASLTSAQLTNPGFETGTLAGWEIAPGPGVSVTGAITDFPIDPITLTEDLTRPYSANPYAGNYQARLVAGATPLGNVESFLNLNPGTLSAAANNQFGLADGSAISQSFFLTSGQSVLIHWNFLAVDTSGFDDFAFASLSGPGGSSVAILSSVSLAGAGQGTGWQSSLLTVNASGEYRFGLGVVNFEDNTVSSILYADAISAVPEPSTYGIVAACICLGTAVWRRRRTRSP